MIAKASLPTASPSSSTAAFVMDAVTIVPLTSRRTCAVVAPLVTSTILPLSLLRALIFHEDSRGWKASRYPYEYNAFALRPSLNRKASNFQRLRIAREASPCDRWMEAVRPALTAWQLSRSR